MKLSWTMRRDIFLAFFLMIVAGALAQDIPGPMSPPRLVNDFANLFSDAEKQALESKLLAYNDSTSTQIYVVTVADLGGYPASDYAFKLGEKWGVGQKSKDNGAVILIKPKTVGSRGQAFIATGYGLEASLNDAVVGRIVRDKMIPYFQADDYFGGANAAADAIIARLSGQFGADDEDEGLSRGDILAMIIVFIVVVILISIFFGKGGDQNIDSGRRNRGNRTVFFPPVTGRGWSGGGWSNGGGFGGGFGGGGGGSFGGGGAGGSW